LGCGSFNVATGDVIALVAGVPAPMMMRKRARKVSSPDAAPIQYQVMCSAFVLGLMAGTAWNDDYTKTLELV
jgi:hypothetical protein